MNFIEELRWRGMIHDITPGTEEQLLKEMTSAYIGYDPTSDSLHIGNLASIMMLVHLQRAGHKPFALVGGATGMIGDPSGKSEERNLLDEKVSGCRFQVAGSARPTCLGERPSGLDNKRRTQKHKAQIG